MKNREDVGEDRRRDMVVCGPLERVWEKRVGFGRRVERVWAGFNMFK